MSVIVQPLTQPPVFALHELYLRSWPADGGQPRPNGQQLILVSAAFKSQVVLTMTVTLASKMHFSSIHCVVQPTTTLLDCMLYLMQDLSTKAFCQALQVSVSLGTCI